MSGLKGFLAFAARAALICLLLLSIWPAQPAAAIPASPSTEGAGTPPAGRLSNLEAIRLIDDLMMAGRSEEAAEICTLLLESSDVNIRVEALFRLGNIFFIRKEYDKAVAAYLSIINAYPGLTRVRLELARTYFADEDYERADFHFRLAQGDTELPEEVRENIELFLKAVRSRKNWSVTGSFGIVPDSNLNYASGEERECISTAYGLLCRDLPDEDAGVGLQAGVRGTHYLKFNKNLGLKSIAAISFLDFEQRAYDDDSLYLAVGPRLLFSNGEVSLQPTYSLRRLGGREYSQSYGARLDTSFDPAERWAVDVGLAYFQTDYADHILNELLRGQTFQAYAGLRYMLTGKSLLTAGLEYVDERTKTASFGSRLFGGSIGYYREFPLAFTAYAELRLSEVRYHAPSLFISADAEIVEARRRDRIYQGYLRLANRRWASIGFTPAISCTYTNRDSNLWNYGYDKFRVEFSFQQEF